MIKVNKNLVLFASLLIALTSSIFYLVQKFSPLLDHAVYYCQSLIKTQMVPIPYYLSLIPSGFIFATIIFSLIKFVLLAVKMTLLKKSLNEKETDYSQINELIEKLRLETKVSIVQSDKRFAFCLGVIKQKIYISTGLLSHLNAEELEAVLRHEQYHLENHDTFTMMLASISNSLIPFFPIIGNLIKKYRIEREIEADTFAVSKIGDRSPLISALKKLLASPTVATVTYAAIADEDTLESRINSLLERPYVRRQFRIKHLLITLFSATMLGAIMVAPVYAKEIHHEEHDVVMFCAAGGECMQSCTSEENMTKLYSEIPTKSSSSNASHPYSENPH